MFWLFNINSKLIIYFTIFYFKIIDILEIQDLILIRTLTLFKIMKIHVVLIIFDFYTALEQRIKIVEKDLQNYNANSVFWLKISLNKDSSVQILLV